MLVTSFLITALATLGIELLARHLGFTPLVTDDADFWCAEREKVHANDRRQIVLVGTSRMQIDVDPDTLGESLQVGAPPQLAVNGSSPIPTLKHLAEETDFKGVVLCDVFPAYFFSYLGFDVGQQEVYVAHFKSRSFISPLESRLARRLQTTSAIRLLAKARDKNLQLWFLSGGKPVPSTRRMLPNRSIVADFKQSDHSGREMGNLRGLKALPDGPIPDDRLKPQLERLESWVRQIQARGGRVVFVCLPSTGAMRREEERIAPRELCWDRFSALSSAACIHCDDYESLSGFECPDGSHLDQSSRLPFTKALAEVLQTTPKLQVAAH